MQVQLPYLRLHKEGKICFDAAEQIKTVLKYLTDVCQVEGLELKPTFLRTISNEAFGLVG